MKKLVETLRLAVAFMAGYTVRVFWDGEIAVHYTLTVKEAMEWMECYPEDAMIFVYSPITSQLITARGHKK